MPSATELFKLFNETLQLLHLNPDLLLVAVVLASFAVVAMALFVVHAAVTKK